MIDYGHAVRGLCIAVTCTQALTLTPLLLVVYRQGHRRDVPSVVGHKISSPVAVSFRRWPWVGTTRWRLTPPAACGPGATTGMASWHGRRPLPLPCRRPRRRRTCNQPCTGRNVRTGPHP